jgi:hypothetical protein
MEDAHTALAECCVRFLSFFANGNSLTKDQGLDVEYDAFLEYSAMIWNLYVREFKICVNEDAAIAPITFKLSDPKAKVYRLWWEIYSMIYYLKGRDFCTSLRVACYSRHIAVAKRSLERDTDIDAQDGGYGNALYEALRRGYEQVVRLLLDKGADVNVQGGYYGNALPGGFTMRL